MFRTDVPVSERRQPWRMATSQQSRIHSSHFSKAVSIFTTSSAVISRFCFAGVRDASARPL